MTSKFEFNNAESGDAEYNYYVDQTPERVMLQRLQSDSQPPSDCSKNDSCSAAGGGIITRDTGREKVP